MARALARRIGRSLQALLRRAERHRHVQRPGTASRYAGARTSDPERNLLPSGNKDSPSTTIPQQQSSHRHGLLNVYDWECAAGVRARAAGSSGLVPALQGVGQRTRFEPGVGPVLPRLPSHLTPTAPIDQPGASICFTQAPSVQVSCPSPPTPPRNSTNYCCCCCCCCCDCRDLELAIPGSYVPNQPVIRISQVNSSLQVITSKQRPRKLCIIGSNGKEYMFLLKGHEDLRQDERVMQLFSLVNTLLIHDPETFRRNLTIQRYAVIPLSTNSGLIGWVPHCDTLHSLIRDYREKKKILLNIEHRIMLRVIHNPIHPSIHPFFLDLIVFECFGDVVDCVKQIFPSFAVPAANLLSVQTSINSGQIRYRFDHFKRIVII